MNVAPQATYEATYGAGVADLTGTIRLGLLDNQGAVVQALSTSGIIETPAGSGVYAATRTSPSAEGQYTLIWSLDGSFAAEQVAIDELVVTGSAPADPVPPPEMYATVEELARILKIRSPTDAQQAALERVLVSATGEVNSEIDRTDDLAAWMVMLATEVALERAVEHWQQEEVPYGIWENALGPVVVGRDTLDRHALKLAPLKQKVGMA